MKWARNAMLNLPGHHSVAAISAELEFKIELDKPDKSGKRITTFDLDGQLYLSDCNRVVCIDLNSWLDKDDIECSFDNLENTQHKIDELVSVASELQKQFKIYKKEAIKWLKS